MSDAEVTAFLAERHTLVLATVGRDGTPHLTSVWYRWDGDSLWISTNADRVKFRNMQRDPRVTALIDAPQRESAVVVYGTSRVAARGPAADAGALLIVDRYVADARAYLHARPDTGRVLIQISVRRMVTWKLAE